MSGNFDDTRDRNSNREPDLNQSMTSQNNTMNDSMQMGKNQIYVQGFV